MKAVPSYNNYFKKMDLNWTINYITEDYCMLKTLQF